jgi:hypothetical protein
VSIVLEEDLPHVWQHGQLLGSQSFLVFVLELVHQHVNNVLAVAREIGQGHSSAQIINGAVVSECISVASLCAEEEAGWLTHSPGCHLIQILDVLRQSSRAQTCELVHILLGHLF